MPGRSIIDQVMARFGAEDREQRAVILWCDQQGWPVWHVPNNTYTTQRFAKVRNMLLGVKRGIPDLFVLTPSGIVAVEMKSKTGSATKEQKEWISQLMRHGVPAAVCKGAEAAISYLSIFTEPAAKYKGRPIPDMPKSGQPPRTPIEPRPPIIIEPTKPFSDELPF